MASTVEKLLFGAGLGLAGTAAIYLYRERRREEQERAKVETPNGKTGGFPFIKMPERETKQESNKTEEAKVGDAPQSKLRGFPFTKMPGSETKPEPEDGTEKEKGADAPTSDPNQSQEIEDHPGKDKSKRSLIKDAKTVVHKAKGALHGEGEEKKDEEVGLFSWLMGRQKAEEEDTEKRKDEDEKK